RTRALQAKPYPCIEQLRFLDLNLAKHPRYSEVLSRLQAGEKLLDAGCCFGQDLRKLIFDGAPNTSNLYGIDNEKIFLDLGYELFRDQSKYQGSFVVMDLLAPAHDTTAINRDMNIVSAFSLLHLFSFAEQKMLACRLVEFRKPKPGSMIIGRQVSTSEPNVYSGLQKGTQLYGHDAGTFRQLWEEVGAATETKWRFEAEIKPAGDNMQGNSFTMPSMGWLYLTLIRE
ncbi:hypothetical protein MMC14_010702, partial [Varicellaria rhodocarpa]|nr:hypothetical protein [Varicellaria rhodocarpa]